MVYTGTMSQRRIQTQVLWDGIPWNRNTSVYFNKPSNRSRAMGNRVRKELEMLIKYVVQREQSEEFKMVNLFTEVKVFYDPMAPKKEFHINFEIHTEH